MFPVHRHAGEVIIQQGMLLKMPCEEKLIKVLSYKLVTCSFGYMFRDTDNIISRREIQE